MHITKNSKMAFKIKIALLAIVSVLLVITCKDPWEEHVKVNENTVEENIIEIIQGKPELLKFYEYLEKTGYDSLLKSSKSFTVWAPSNTALKSLDNYALSDTAKLKSIIGNHISYGKYMYMVPSGVTKVKSLAGKYILLDYINGKADSAILSEPWDFPAKNGVIHVIDKALQPSPSVWEIIETTDLCPKHTGYLNSLTRLVFDPEQATQTGVDPFTGLPVYDTLNGLVWKNNFLSEVLDMSDEGTFSTVILITDKVFDQELDKFRKYYTPVDSTKGDSVTSWMICRDLVFPGKLGVDEIGDTLISMYNVKVPFNKSSSVLKQTLIASNGIIYVLDDCAIKKEDKILPVLIEAEDTNSVVFTYVTGRTPLTRYRPGASGGYDFIVDDHGANPGYVMYKTGSLCAITYKCYWRAIDDFNYSHFRPSTTDTIRQNFSTIEQIGELKDVKHFTDENEIAKYFNSGNVYSISQNTVVADTSYESTSEKELGLLVRTHFTENLWARVSSSGRNTTISLDYIKLVPQFE